MPYAISAAALAITLRMVYFFTLAPDEDWDMRVRFAYLLLFLLSLFLGLRMFKRAVPTSTFAADIKAGMKTASVFALILAAFTWVYYKWVNPAYFQTRIEEVAEAASGQDAEKATQTAAFIFNAFSHATITLFGLMVIGFFYTIVLVLVMRGRSKA